MTNILRIVKVWRRLSFSAKVALMKERQKKLAILNADPALAEMVNRLVDEFHPYKIFLFGSRATSNFSDDSDYDLLIVMPEPGDSRKLAVRAYDLLEDLGGAKDILFTHREKFERRKTVVNTIAEIVTTDGTELYAA